MYWQDRYPTPAHAVRALKLSAAGRVRLSPTDAHIAHVAARSGVSGISEDPNNLGFVPYRLTEDPFRLSGLKKDIKSALKSDDAAKIASALAREQAKIDKAPDSKKVAKRIEYVKQLAARAASLTTPATAVIPGAPVQPIPQLPAPGETMSFSQGGGGNPGTSMMTPEPQAASAEVASGDGMSIPLMLGIGAAGLLALYLLKR